MRGSDDRMASKGNLMIHSEDFHSTRLSETLAIVQEDGLAVVEFSCYLLLLCLREAVATDRNDRERIALVSFSCEDLKIVSKCQNLDVQ